jgi:hypothetical protein
LDQSAAPQVMLYSVIVMRLLAARLPRSQGMLSTGSDTDGRISFLKMPLADLCGRRRNARLASRLPWHLWSTARAGHACSRGGLPGGDTASADANQGERAPQASAGVSRSFSSCFATLSRRTAGPQWTFAASSYARLLRVTSWPSVRLCIGAQALLFVLAHVQVSARVCTCARVCQFTSRSTRKCCKYNAHLLQLQFFTAFGLQRNLPT